MVVGLTESGKSPASIAQSNKQWVGTCLYQEWYKPLLISCEAVVCLVVWRDGSHSLLRSCRVAGVVDTVSGAEHQV